MPKYLLKNATSCSAAASANAVSPTLSGVAQTRIGVGAGGARAADEIADQQRHQVARHLRRPGEDDGVLAGFGPRRIRDLPAVRDRRVAGVDHQRHVERRLVRRLVEGRKGAPRIGRFHLADGVVTAVGLAQVKAAQLVVEQTGVGNVDGGGATRNRARDLERRRLVFLVERDRCGLRSAGILDRDVAKRDLRRMQRDRRRRRGERHGDRLAAAEGGLLEIRRKPQACNASARRRREAAAPAPMRPRGRGQPRSESVPHPLTIASNSRLGGMPGPAIRACRSRARS